MTHCGSAVDAKSNVKYSFKCEPFASANSERLSETKIKRITLITVHRSIVRQSAGSID